MLLGTRDSVIKRRTQLGNTLRGYAAEFGVVARKGLSEITPLLTRIEADEGIPDLAKEMFATLGQELAELAPRIAQLDKRLKAWQRSNELCRRLAEIPTVGPIGACLLPIKISNPAAFRSGRMCAAWLGLTPKDHSTAGKPTIAPITPPAHHSLPARLL